MRLIPIDYQVQDSGVMVHCNCPDPDASVGFVSDLYLFCTDAELPTNLNQNQLQTLLTTKATRKYGSAGKGVAPLNTLITSNWSVVV